MKEDEISEMSFNGHSLRYQAIKTGGGIQRMHMPLVTVFWGRNWEEPRKTIVNAYRRCGLTAADDAEYVTDNGGRRDSDSNDYYWVDQDNQLYGEMLNSPNYWAWNAWMNNEPSFRDGEIEEAYMDILYFSGEGRWTWNDVPNDIVSVVEYFSGKIGYIVEYDD